MGLRGVAPRLLSIGTIAVGGSFVHSKGWDRKAGAVALALLADFDLNVVNGDAMAPHDADPLLMAGQITGTQHVKIGVGESIHADSPMDLVQFAAVVLECQKLNALTFLATPQTIGAGLTVPVKFPLLLPFTDARLASLRGRMDESDLASYIFKCTTALNCGNVNLSVASGTVTVYAMEVETPHVEHGSPLRFDVAFPADADQPFPAPAPTDVIASMTTGDRTTLFGYTMQVKRGVRTVIEGENVATVAATAQTGEDDGYSLNPMAGGYVAIPLITQIGGYSESEVPAGDLRIKLRGGIWPVSSRLITVAQQVRSDASIARIKAGAFRLAAQGKRVFAMIGGRAVAAESLDRAALAKYPLVIRRP